MAMEVVAAMPPSPTRFGDYFFSAPTSPSRLSDFYGPADPPAVDDDDFAFEFREDLERTSLSADELFVGGVIRLLGKPPAQPPPPPTERGRSPPAPAEDLTPSRSGRRAARSLSPPPKQQRQQMIVVSPKPSASAASSKKKSSSWRLRDFLLFRSASEGRAAEKDPLRKYYAPAAASGRTRAVSAHEVHYTANKAVSEGLKKKTFLPYKQGILGRLAFNPALHAIANGFGSLTRP